MSDDGRSRPSTTSPLPRSTTTIDSRPRARRTETPLGLIAITPAERSTALALPKVRTTSPASTIARFASSTRSRSCMAISGTTSLRRAGSTPGSSGARSRSRAIRVRSSITSNSMPAISREVGRTPRRRLRGKHGVVRAAGDAATPRRRWRGRAAAATPPARRAAAAGPRRARRARPRSATAGSGRRGRAVPTMTAGPGRRREDEPHRIVAAADRERMDLARRPPPRRSRGRPRACGRRAPSAPPGARS